MTTSKFNAPSVPASHAVSDHFVDVNKMVKIGANTQREISDIMPNALEESSVVKPCLITAADGKSCRVDHHPLEVIL
jgi:hypothetical protein